MSDGHLYLSAHGGVDYAGDSRHAWYDATHQSVLVLSPRSRKLRQIALDASLDPMEPSISTSSPSEERVSTLYDFTEPDHPPPTRHGGQQKTTRRRSESPILLLQMSVDGQFLAIQRSDIEVQVVHRATRATYWVLCKSKAGNRILHGGVLWNTHASQASSSQDLFLVTKLGLEHYRVSTKRRSCALHRTMGVYVHAFWYAASHGVLLVSSGSRANEIVPFLLHGANVEKLPRLVFSTSVSSQDLHLVCLYGDLYAVYSDTKSTKLLLYLVGRTKVTCVRSLNLMLPPGTALEYSVVDNLLVCHSLDFNVSLFFDVKCDGNVSDPFSAPLPVSSRSPGPHPEDGVGGAMTGSATPESITRVSSSPSIVDAFEEFDAEAVEMVDDEEGVGEKWDVGPMWGSPQATLRIRRALSVDDLEVHRYIEEDALPLPSFKTSPASHLARRRSARRLQRAMTAASLGNVEQLQHEVDVPSFSRWRFYAPNFVLRSFTVNGRNDFIEQVEVRKLQVNLSEVCKSCERHPEILPFLLRRGDYVLAKRLVLRLVKDHIVEQQATLASIVQLFSTVQTISHSEGNHETEELVSCGDRNDGKLGKVEGSLISHLVSISMP
ncbi:hypothetical protein BBJ28_00004116 [Nothophytophthora sp. Chile5]|nr:hypothetical protein BBJ28_00004116 [Nothophytophthora sp. Chile5]